MANGFSEETLSQESRVRREENLSLFLPFVAGGVAARGAALAETKNHIFGAQSLDMTSLLTSF